MPGKRDSGKKRKVQEAELTQVEKDQVEKTARAFVARELSLRKQRAMLTSSRKLERTSKAATIQQCTSDRIEELLFLAMPNTTRSNSVYSLGSDDNDSEELSDGVSLVNRFLCLFVSIT